MLPKLHRLAAAKDFDAVFSGGRASNSRGVSVKAVKNNLGVTRVGFVVSTKVAKRAVVRNKIKRRMREVLRKHIHMLYRGADIVCIARPEAKDMEYADFVAALGEALGRAGLISKT